MITLNDRARADDVTKYQIGWGGWMLSWNIKHRGLRSFILRFILSLKVAQIDYKYPLD